MPDIRRHVLSDGDVSVAILSLGCITQDWRVPVAGSRVPVVLGYQNLRDYLANPYFLGVIAGRVANRISGAGFSIDGRAYDLPVNEAPNHLHGGPPGLHAQHWTMEPDGARAVHLQLLSDHGDQGYPGRVALAVTISLRGHTLRYDMQATTDRPTPINLAQHSYYNLMGQGMIWDHRLHIDADRFTPVDAAMIPTGDIENLTGKAFDMRQEKPLHLADPGRRGLDMNYILNTAPDRPVAIVTAPNGLQLTLSTDQPCIQLYTAAHLLRSATPLAGQTHTPFSAICLEPQQYPNAVNTPGFPSILIDPDHPYCQTTSVRIAPEGT